MASTDTTSARAPQPSLVEIAEEVLDLVAALVAVPVLLVRTIVRRRRR